MEGIKWIDSLGVETPKRSRPYTLEGIKKVLSCFDNPQNKLKVIHVAGTNGKGSVVQVVASCLNVAGFKTGTYLSPHLNDVSERFLLNLKTVNRELLSDILLEVKQVVDRTAQSLSYFETLVVAAFLLFERQKVDYAIIEVGLGGLLDATNVVKKSEVAVITSISFDHTHILGDTIEQIAAQKSGIIKQNSLVVVGDVTTPAYKVIKETAEQNLAKGFYCYGEDFWLEDQTTFYDGVNNFSLRNGVAHQVKNWAVAAKVCLLLGISRDDIQKGIRMSFIAGRLERLEVKNSKGTLTQVLLDVSHNEESIAGLCTYLKDNLNHNKIIAIFSALETKAWEKMLSDFARSIKKEVSDFSLYATKSDHVYAVDPVLIPGSDKVFEKPEDAVCAAIDELDENSLLIVFGSIFLVGQVRQFLLKKIEE